MFQILDRKKASKIAATTFVQRFSPKLWSAKIQIRKSKFSCWINSEILRTQVLSNQSQGIV